MCPATQLLYREDIENNRRDGFSVSVGIRSNNLRQSFTDASVDLLYGFRGNDQGVETLSAFELLRYWSRANIGTPTQQPRRSTWTTAGENYAEACKLSGERPTFVPGVHYEALKGDDRLLIANFPHLHHLRHTWCWERRERPHVPVWTFANIPRASFSPEENARIISVCM